jgi:hypothetical protein
MLGASYSQHGAQVIPANLRHLHASVNQNGVCNQFILFYA